MESLQRDIREFMWVAGPKGLGALLQVAINLLLLRFLGPESFGLLSVCIATVILCDSIFGSAIDMSIFRLAPVYTGSERRRALQIQKAGLTIKPIGGLLAALLLVPFASPVSAVLFQRKDQAPLLYLTLTALLGVLLIRSTQVHFQIERQFKDYGYTDLLYSCLRFGGVAVLLLVGVSAPAPILGMYATAPLLISFLVLATWARPMAAVPASRDARRTLLRTLKWLLPTVVAGSVVSRMDLFFVSAFAGVREAGVYSAAQVFASLPAAAGIYMSAVFSPRVMRLWREGSLKRIYTKYQAGLALAAIGTFVLVWAGFRSITATLLPASFRAASGPLLALLPAGLCSFINFPWTVPLLVYLRPRLMLALDCVTVIILAPLYISVVRASGAMGCALLTSGFMIVRTIIHQSIAWRVIVQGPKATMENLEAREMLRMGEVA